MKGDFSRFTGLSATLKHYNQVLKQQGRVQLDSDWNELNTIIGHQRRVRTIDSIGACGAPIHSSGYQILHPGDGSLTLLFSSGRFYAGGLLCETTPSSKLPINQFPSAQSIQVDDLNIDGQDLENGQWVQVMTDETPEGIIAKITLVDGTSNTITLDTDLSALDAGDQHHPHLRRLLLYSDQEDLPEPPALSPIPSGGRTDLVYLDVWERHTTSIEDPDLREVALGGPDTDTRSRVIAQVKVLPHVGDVDCNDLISPWEDLLEKPDGRLSSRPAAPETADTPCELGESGGYLGLENRLYRIEIHDGGSLDSPGTGEGTGTGTGSGPTFKWSRDNASHAYAIEAFIEETGGQVFQVRLNQPGKDNYLKIKQGDYVEISSEESDLDTTTAGIMAKVDGVDETLITLDTDVGSFKDQSLPKLRRWDISNHRTEGLTEIAGGPVFQLEDGVEIEFSGSEFRTGDYWVFSARTLTGTLEELDKARPYGVEHHYCRLALVHWQDGDSPVIEDCRPEFPPLTELPGGGGCCTVTVGPNQTYTDIQAGVDALKGGPGTVCVEPGMYWINQPVDVDGMDITIKGCGGSPYIFNLAKDPQDGALFRVKGSQFITIQHIWGATLGSRAVEVENTLFFNLQHCVLFCGGSSDLNGVVTIRGLTLNTHMEDNLLLGISGIYYAEDPEQQLNLHLNARMERNIAFVLQSGLAQDGSASIIGLDFVDNLMLGFNLALLAKAFFPEALFSAAEEEELFDREEMARAREARREGASYETIDKRNPGPARELEHYLRNESAAAKAEGATIVAPQFQSTSPIVNLTGAVLDANCTDNLLMGAAGIFIRMGLELNVETNVLMATSHGLIMQMVEGAMVRDNMITAGSIGVYCAGSICLNLAVENNRLVAGTDGIAFAPAKEVPVQLVWNFLAGNNLINAKYRGIVLFNPGIILQDLTLVDNTLLSSELHGIYIGVFDENQFQASDQISLQRVIQRNSISTKGNGIVLDVSDSRVLDNEVNINHLQEVESPDSWGIALVATNGVIAGNTIQGRVQEENEVYSQGGIFLAPRKAYASTRLHQVEVRQNQIIGGIGNGIEIANTLPGLVIEQNQISHMGLNGIATREGLTSLENLRVKDNTIHDCLQQVGASQSWWAYAGIVLTTIREAQICGNTIRDNGNNINQAETYVSAIYAEHLYDTLISGNLCLNNQTQADSSPQAAIHIPLGNLFGNNNIQILNNRVHNTATPLLELGGFICLLLNDILLCSATDGNTLISGNHFESALEGPVVNLHLSQSAFSNNYVSCNGVEGSSVNLGYGWNVLATGNVVALPITGSGLNQQIISNLEF